VRQADVLGQVIVGAKTQARHRVEFAVSRSEKNDWQVLRAASQIAAQLEAAFDVILQIDIDDDEVRQSSGKCVQRRSASGEQVD
jgi:hypothetical protein